MIDTHQKTTEEGNGGRGKQGENQLTCSQLRLLQLKYSREGVQSHCAFILGRDFKVVKKEIPCRGSEKRLSHLRELQRLSEFEDC